MKDLVLVTGMPGVGKTAVLNEFEKIAKKRKVSTSIINYGSIMNSILKNKGKELTRDEIRKQKMNSQKEIQLKAADIIVKKSEKNITIVDTHMAINTKAGFLPGLPYDVLKKLDPCLLVLIETAPKDILKRRGLDNSRDRDSQSIQEIELGLEWSRYLASACSTLIGIPVKILKNEHGKQKEVANNLFNSILEQLGD
jgi:adenylate kinase